jgi:hypothetical protein
MASRAPGAKRKAISSSTATGRHHHPPCARLDDCWRIRPAMKGMLLAMM